ncbi:MAG: glycosyltransferase family 39 protein [Bacteroidota bacterium]
MPLPILLVGFATILFFFLGVRTYIYAWKNCSDFKTRLFFHSLLYRLIAVAAMYVLTMEYDPNNLPFQIAAQDAWNYHYTGVIVADALDEGSGVFKALSHFWKSESDYGFSICIGFIYSIFGKSVTAVKIFNAILASFTVLRIYQITQFAYGEKQARIAGILTMLMPPLLWFTSMLLKETLLIFLIANIGYYCTRIIKTKKFRIANTAIILLLFGTIFFFRTVLVPLLVGCVLLQIVFYKTKNRNYRVFAGFITLVLIVGSLFVTYELSMDKHIESAIESSSEQFGNELDKASKDRGINYTAALIAPLLISGAIITPFPSLLDFEERQLGIYAHFQNEIVRNIMYFFVFLGLFRFIKLRKATAIFPASFAVLYIMILAVSGISFQDRFQILALPFLIVFMSDGITAKYRAKEKHWFVYLSFIFLAILAWNIFKLSNRGLF